MKKPTLKIPYFNRRRWTTKLWYPRWTYEPCKEDISFKELMEFQGFKQKKKL